MAVEAVEEAEDVGGVTDVDVLGLNVQSRDLEETSVFCSLVSFSKRLKFLRAFQVDRLLIFQCMNIGYAYRDEIILI